MGSIGVLISVFLVLGVFSPCLRVFGNAELGALMELKASLDPEGKYLSSWTEDGDPCSGTFEGVACNEKSKVANVSLQGKGLSGRVSPAVAELRCLSGLYLHYNNLSGEIPKEIGALTELTDLYLNVNNLSGSIPHEIGNMTSLQVLQLCCNQLNGSIPTHMGSLTRLNVLALQYNRITGHIPANLGNLGMLKRLDLGFNKFFGTIPAKLASIPTLEVLDVRNNSLSGVVSPDFKRLNEGFESANNPALCGVGFYTLRACTSFDLDRVNVDGLPLGPNLNNTIGNAPQTANPESVDINTPCNQNCTKSTKFPKVAVIAGAISLTVTLAGSVFLALVRNRRKKQKIGNTCDPSDGQLTDQAKEYYMRSPSPLVSLEYSNAWDPLADGQNGLGFSFSQEYLKSYWFNMEDVESATQYFSEVNLLGKSKFSSVYKGVLRDGSLVAVKSINVTSCKSEEAEFVKGLHLLFSLSHENLVKLKGFCCSRGRGECFLIYDFVPNGNLSRYIDVIEGKNQVLDWSKRVSIISGIAKGIGYLHSSEENKPAIIHQNISVEKVLIDQQFKPLISDSGLPKLLADDIVFSTLKTSAAMGYLAPEYITTGRFTEKSDVYAFGVIVLQVISGNVQLSTSMRLAAESSRHEGFVDTNIKGQFSESEAAALAKLGLECTHELPDQRPTMQTVIQELSNLTTC